MEHKKRNIRIKAKRRQQPDYRKLSRALLALAAAQAEADAEALGQDEAALGQDEAGHQPDQRHHRRIPDTENQGKPEGRRRDG